ncbi:MAG TPA: hypothetical protein VND99_00515 [Candidatus Acidoferrales bacterium]|nr:hypothetical protein [Candidatus Acidoferrales bacterium]
MLKQLLHYVKTKSKHMQFQDYAALAFALVLLSIIAFIILVIFQPHSPSTQIVPKPTPEYSTSTNTSTPRVFYNQTSITKILNSSNNPPTLTNNDTLAKAKILTNLPQGQQTGLLYQTNDISINYIHDADEFYVVIFSNNINAAKAEAVVWLEANGMSQQAICNYPIIFYPSSSVQTYLQQTHIVFSLLAPGC